MNYSRQVSLIGTLLNTKLLNTKENITTGTQMVYKKNMK